MKFDLESNSETYMFSKSSNNFFGNPREFSCFIPSMVQNNMISTKIGIKSKLIKSTWIQKYDRSPLGLKMWDLNVFFQKLKESSGRWRLET